MNNYPNTIMKVIPFSVMLISGAFGSAFAGDLKEICFIGTNAAACETSQKEASKPKSGCFSKVVGGTTNWCYFWNPNGSASGITLGNMLTDVNFADAFNSRVYELVEENQNLQILEPYVGGKLENSFLSVTE